VGKPTELDCVDWRRGMGGEDVRRHKFRGDGHIDLGFGELD
jgi:hypothetical protein